MSWLTEMNLDHATVARHHLHDTYRWHQAAWECFPGRPVARRDFLTRLEESVQGFRLLLVSAQPATRPDW